MSGDTVSDKNLMQQFRGRGRRRRKKIKKGAAHRIYDALGSADK
jgi:hypothetical protein